jgi:protein-disulfide isomerase
MMRARLGEKFIFIEAAILGPKSRELAAISLGAASLGNYVEAHHMLFELSGGSISGAINGLAPIVGTDIATLNAASNDAARILDQHIALAAVLEIKVTPTYVLQGRPRIGILARQGE